MAKSQEETSETVGTLPYVIGGLSFIPLVGVLFGVCALIWGLATKKRGGKRVAALGAGGVAFTVLLYGSLFYFGFVQRGGVYDDLRAKLAQTALNSLVPSIEFYKIENGKYPESLEALKASLPKDSLVMPFDPSGANASGKPRYFYYERVDDDHYYLRGVGVDGKPFTPDDILPQVASTTGSKIGLLLNRRAGP